MRRIPRSGRGGSKTRSPSPTCHPARPMTRARAGAGRSSEREVGQGWLSIPSGASALTYSQGLFVLLRCGTADVRRDCLTARMLGPRAVCLMFAGVWQRCEQEVASPRWRCARSHRQQLQSPYVNRPRIWVCRRSASHSLSACERCEVPTWTTWAMARPLFLWARLGCRFGRRARGRSPWRSCLARVAL